MQKKLCEGFRALQYMYILQVCSTARRSWGRGGGMVLKKLMEKLFIYLFLLFFSPPPPLTLPHTRIVLGTFVRRPFPLHIVCCDAMPQTQATPFSLLGSSPRGTMSCRIQVIFCPSVQLYPPPWAPRPGAPGQVPLAKAPRPGAPGQGPQARVPRPGPPS